VGWLKSWPELRDVVAVCIGAVVILVLLGVWVATGRVPPWEFLAGGFSAIALERAVKSGSVLYVAVIACDLERRSNWLHYRCNASRGRETTTGRTLWNSESA